MVNRSIYDSFTLISLAKSDLNLIAVKADVDKLREFNNYIAFLKDKQHIPIEKTRFIAYEYDKSVCLGLSEVREATREICRSNHIQQEESCIQESEVSLCRADGEGDKT